jgi:hypothetical protein
MTESVRTPPEQTRWLVGCAVMMGGAIVAVVVTETKGLSTLVAVMV